MGREQILTRLRKVEGQVRGLQRMVAEEREILEWQQFGDACRELTQSVVDSGFEPDIVLSITRGGLLPEVSPDYRRACLDLAKAVGQLAGEDRHA